MPAYANQRDVVIHKIVNSKNYLTINNDDWMDAFKKLRTGKKGLMVAFGLYLYLARINTNITNWSLSCADVMNKLNISKSSYHRAFDKLVELGYMRLNEDGTYDVYINKEDHTDIECPIYDTDDDDDEDDDECPIYGTESSVYETIDNVPYMKQSHIRNENVPYMIQNSPTYEYSNNINKDNNNKNMGEVIPQTPSSVMTNKEIVEMTREQANRRLQEASTFGIKYKITNGMYEFPKQFLKVIDEPPLKEKEKPKDPDAFDFI